MIRVYIFSIIERLVEAGGKTRGMRREHAPVPCFFFLVFFHLLVTFAISLFLASTFHLFSSLLFTLARCIHSVFVLHDTSVRRKRVIPKVLTLGHKICTYVETQRVSTFFRRFYHIYTYLKIIIIIIILSNNI